MATEIRPELSEKNPYWIGKHRYYELKHFCLQYPIWKKAYNALLGLSSRPNDLDIFVKSGQVRSDPTARCAESRVSFAKRMELVEQAAICTDGDLYPYILRGVTEGLSYPAMIGTLPTTTRSTARSGSIPPISSIHRHRPCTCISIMSMILTSCSPVRSTTTKTTKGCSCFRSSFCPGSWPASPSSSWA